MPDESIKIAQDKSELTLNLFWYQAHHDLQISEVVNGELMARILFVPDPVVLRELANQFYDWAEMLENHYRDLMEDAITKRDDELVYKLKQHEKHKDISWKKSRKG